MSNRNAFLASYLKTISFAKGIIVSDREGIQLNFALADPETEGKYWPISSMLIAALNQTNDNINKVEKGVNVDSEGTEGRQSHSAIRGVPHTFV